MKGLIKDKEMKNIDSEMRQELISSEATAMSMTEEEFFAHFEKSMISNQQFFMYYRCAIMEIETKFKVLNEQFSINSERNPIEFIQSRIKSYGSLYRKMIAKDIPRTYSAMEANIYDIAGVRVVCSFIEDIYRLADCFLRQDDIRLIERKDYISEPKANGYRSLHLIVEVPIFLENEKKPVRVEVQLRTIAMDFWASLEHKLRYKKDIQPETLGMLTSELKTCADESAALDKRMQVIKNIISGEI